MTTDTAAAQTFYKQALGWGTEQWGDDAAKGYTMWTTKQGPIGGVMLLPEEAKKMGAPPHWLAYIGTEDVDATLKHATELGAKVYVPVTQIPKVGRFAVLADPQGAVFAIFTSDNPMPPHDMSGAGEMCWHELYTTDPVAGLTFYSTLFGWQKTTQMDMGPDMGIYQMYGQGDKTYGGIMKKPAQMQAPSAWLFYTSVDSVDHAINRINELGGKITMGPHDVPTGGRIAMAIDPQGAAFAVHQAPKK